MSDIDTQVADMLADGRITEGDAEVIREFAAFLGKTGKINDTSPEEARKSRRALIEHAELCGLDQTQVDRLWVAVEEQAAAEERARIVWWLRAGVDGPAGMSIMASERQLLLDLADVIEQHHERFAGAPTSEPVTPPPDGT